MCRRAPLAVVTAALVSFASGCAEETSPAEAGDLRVDFRVGSGSNTCADVGIEFVRVDIRVSETEDLLDQLFICDSTAQSVTFFDVPVGTFIVSVEGLNGDNSVIYRGQATAPVTIEANRTNGPVTVGLDQLRPSMEIFFAFSDADDCDQLEVIDLVVRVYENGTSSIYDQSLECASQITHSLLISDLSDSSSYDLRVRGTNDYGEYTYEYNADGIVLGPGASTVIAAELTACAVLCSAP